jgi:hypothetical protein
VAALRQPYFDRSDALPAFQKVVRGQGLIPVTWTVDPNYYLYGGRPEGVLPSVMRADNAGRKGESDEVLLLHDNHEGSPVVPSRDGLRFCRGVARTPLLRIDAFQERVIQRDLSLSMAP